MGLHAMTARLSPTQPTQHASANTGFAAVPRSVFLRALRGNPLFRGTLVREPIAAAHAFQRRGFWVFCRGAKLAASEDTRSLAIGRIIPLWPKS